jgi:hypothetical protein
LGLQQGQRRDRIEVAPVAVLYHAFRAFQVARTEGARYLDGAAFVILIVDSDADHHARLTQGRRVRLILRMFAGFPLGLTFARKSKRSQPVTFPITPASRGLFLQLLNGTGTSRGWHSQSEQAPTGPGRQQGTAKVDSNISCRRSTMSAQKSYGAPAQRFIHH